MLTKVIPMAVMVIAVMLLIFSSGINDSDADGIEDSLDNCPDLSNNDQSDFDGDHFGDACDPDDDNDNYLDELDLFDQDPTEWSDFDLDQIGDNSDPDDDNDNVVDVLDFFDYDHNYWADFDFDGIATENDPDDDNDGIYDLDDDTPIPISEQLATQNLHEIQACAILESGTSRLLCYGNLFDDLVDQKDDAKGALELSIALAKLEAIDDCHFVSHEIGHAVYQSDSDVTENLRGMDGTMCRGGYFHGILAAYFHDIKENGKEFPQSYRTTCDGLIGTSGYQDCIHGLGHGFVHYYLDDLYSAIDKCHDLSFYQNILCINGLMMQYTDNQITKHGITERTMSNMCSKTTLDELDYQQCNLSLGSTLAFHTNHQPDVSMSCELINDPDGKKFCHEGLEGEIQESEQYEVSPLTDQIREKFQPQTVLYNSKNYVVDLVSPAIISNFVYDEQTKTIQFEFNKQDYITMYIPQEIMNKKSIITVNANIQNNVSVSNINFGEPYAVIDVFPDSAGILRIISLN